MASSLYLYLTLLLSACYLRSYPLTPAVAREATFRVITGGFQGTGWAVDKHHLVTAGHMCEEGTEFVVLGQFRRFTAKAKLWDYNAAKYDACVLETETALDNWLIIADAMPSIGTQVSYVGYPAGEYTEQTGAFLGDLDGDQEYNNAVFSAWCTGGASGSAVYTPQGVWGVLVRRRTDGGVLHDGSDGCVAVALPELKKLLRDADISYSVPPEIPEAPDDI